MGPAVTAELERVRAATTTPDDLVELGHGDQHGLVGSTRLCDAALTELDELAVAPPRHLSQSDSLSRYAQLQRPPTQGGLCSASTFADIAAAALSSMDDALDGSHRDGCPARQSGDVVETTEDWQVGALLQHRP